MSTLVTILHVVVCLFLMLTVLLQQGKGGMGGAFGGSNAGSVFGGGGASGFLRKLTATAAGVFMLTSMVLAFLATADAGDALAEISKREVARKKREKESQRKLLEAAANSDAGVGTVDTAGDAGTEPLTPPPVGPSLTEPAIPGELVPPATQPPVETPPSQPPATQPPATQPPAQPGASAPGTTLNPPAPANPTPRPPAAPAPAPAAPGSAAPPANP